MEAYKGEILKLYIVDKGTQENVLELLKSHRLKVK